MIDAPAELLDATFASLRAAGACFALVHGSRLSADHGPTADLDVAGPDARTPTDGG